MKNFKRILMLILVFSLTLALFACGETTDNTPCKKHKDADDDGLCDVCDECVEHYDDDEDGLCDVCDACVEHIDDDEDGFCDACDEEMPEDSGSDGEDIVLIEDEEVLFQVVLGSDLDIETRMYIDSVVDIFDGLDAELKVVDDKNGNEADVEVLVGTVTSRGEEYQYKKTDLGMKGYAITHLGDGKIAIAAGSEAKLLETLKLFFEEYLGADKRAKSLDDFSFGAKYDKVEAQDDYRVTAITLGGNSLKDYVIVKDSDYSDTNNAAKQLQSVIYEKTGIWLDIVDSASANAIKLTVVGKDQAGNKGFLGEIDGDDYIFKSGYANKYPDMIKEFTDKLFPTGVTGEVAIENFTPDGYANRVTYKEFHAVGDGRTDDSDAIRAAHEFANKGGQTVYAESGKTYYIAGPCDTISIKTNVDWSNCKFIFDDTKVTGSTTKAVFSIDTDTPNAYLTSGDFFKAINNDSDGDGIVIKGINHGDEKTMKLGNGLGYPALLTVYDSTARKYVRWGYPDGQVHTQEEIVLIDAEGNVDPSTPFLIDYEKVTKVRVQRLDNVEPITVKNTTITTWATKINKAGNITRNIIVNRPYTTLEGIKHKIEGEYEGVNIGMLPGETRTPIKYNEELGYWEDATKYGFYGDRSNVYDSDGKKYTKGDVVLMSGVTYTGIINVSFSEGVTVRNCEIQARMYYGSGTYDLNLYNANNVTFENCIQTNFFDETRGTYYPNLSRCWGVMGSNYCKNLVFNDCRLTRFDAHCGVYNAEMNNCDVALIRLIGGGDFILNNTTFYFHQSGAPIQLREDYGATFNGTVTVKDCTINATSTSIAGLISAPTANWDNGYGTYFPNLVIDNLKLGTAQTEFQLVIYEQETAFSSKNLYPSRSPITANVHDPDALFDVYYTTKTADLVEKNPDMFPYLKGFKKVNKDYTVLKNGEYTVVDHGDGTYTIVAKGAKNVRPYYPPEKIEIKNMKNFKNAKGTAVVLKLYNAEFFASTQIIDPDKVLKRDKVPTKK